MLRLFSRARARAAPAQAILKYEKSLREIYRAYSATDDDGLSTKGERMSLPEWQQLMRDANIIDSHFTKREANICFFWSVCFVADEVRLAGTCIMLHITLQMHLPSSDSRM